VLALVVVWTPAGRRPKRALQLGVLVVSVLLTGIVFDLALRFVLPPPYTPEGDVYHRRPDTVFEGVTRDAPETAFSYPDVKPGYPEFGYTLTTDGRGFRNTSALEACDVLVIGDSFAEASEVSDEHAWPVLVAERTGKRVYNLGMAGTNPRAYLAGLRQIGLAMKPKVVVLLFYEGNDFRVGKAKDRTGFKYAMRVYRKRSPVLNALKRVMTRAFGPIGAVRAKHVDDDHPLWPVAWLPVSAAGKHYAFEWKRLAAHWVNDADFRSSPDYAAATELVGQMHALCRDRDIRLAVVYAPDKSHVVLPAARGAIGPEQFRAFLALKLKDLPGASACLETLVGRVDVRENALGDFCRSTSIPFYSLTRVLRDATAAGTQTYFTYDQHWTPDGNRVVADAVTHILDGPLAKGIIP